MRVRIRVNRAVFRASSPITGQALRHRLLTAENAEKTRRERRENQQRKRENEKTGIEH
jgi:hypothetical protein